MKYTFHENPDPGASENTIAVFRAPTETTAADPATPEEINRILIALNGSPINRSIEIMTTKV